MFEMSLPEEEVERMKELRRQGLSYRSISKIVNRPLSTVYEICKDVRPEKIEEVDVLDVVEKMVDEKIAVLWEHIKSLIDNDLAFIEVLIDRKILKVDVEKFNLWKEKVLEDLKKVEKKLGV